METTCNLPRDDKTVGRNDKAMFILNFNDPAALIQEKSNYFSIKKCKMQLF